MIKSVLVLVTANELTHCTKIKNDAIIEMKKKTKTSLEKSDNLILKKLNLTNKDPRV